MPSKYVMALMRFACSAINAHLVGGCHKLQMCDWYWPSIYYFPMCIIREHKSLWAFCQISLRRDDNTALSSVQRANAELLSASRTYAPFDNYSGTRYNVFMLDAKCGEITRMRTDSIRRDLKNPKILIMNEQNGASFVNSISQMCHLCNFLVLIIGPRD